MSTRGTPTEYFATAWTDSDCDRLGIIVGDHRFQTVVEAYAVLIGVRAWVGHWALEPTVVVVKSDSLAALGAAQRGGSTKSPALNRILKELALTIAAVPSGLRLSFQHVAGVRNEWADALSRLAQPGSGARVPPPLLRCTRTAVEGRGAEFWMTSQVPGEEGEENEDGGVE